MTERNIVHNLHSNFLFCICPNPRSIIDPRPRSYQKYILKFIGLLQFYSYPATISDFINTKLSWTKLSQNPPVFQDIWTVYRRQVLSEVCRFPIMLWRKVSLFIIFTVWNSLRTLSLHQFTYILGSMSMKKTNLVEID